ncbi:MAG: hypothetical protein CL624_13110 [Arcobacter sp.]|nr:hypothetical protein [Arcobacter sp.]|tara:strand:- start:7509 stop:7904 length:396 start_codon:yes stop_codon:yes gene_type:complete
MNRLNPLYIIALISTVLFVSLYSLEDEKKSFYEKKDELNLIIQKSKDYRMYKETWNNESFVDNTIDNILKSRQFSNQKILRVKTKNSLKIKIQSTDQNILNIFLNKILNKKLIISKLEVEKSFVNVEIGFN